MFDTMLLATNLLKLLSTQLDQTQYFENFNTRDQELRQCQDCRQMYESTLRYPTSNEQVFLKEQVGAALSTPLLQQLMKLRHLKYWILVFRQGEYPYPHTHGRFIMLPESWLEQNMKVGGGRATQKTLIHELIHVYQRFHPGEANVYVTRVLGYQAAGYLSNSIHGSSRSNPDKNFIIYKDADGQTLSSEYGEGSKTKDARDHPFEVMAYYLADVLFGDRPPSQQDMMWLIHYMK